MHTTKLLDQNKLYGSSGKTTSTEICAKLNNIHTVISHIEHVAYQVSPRFY